MRRGGLLAALACVCVLAAVPPTSAPATSSHRRQSVLFWLAWDGGKLAKVPWRDVTQVDLFSLATCVGPARPFPDCTGPSSLSQSDNSVSHVRAFVRTVHAHHRLALISIGGSDNPNWYYPCSPSDVEAFARTLVEYMRSNGFDGIDLDIEQDGNAGSPVFTTVDLQACTQAVHDYAKAVRTALGRVPIITSDVDPTIDFDIGKIQKPYVDQFNAMSYGVKGRALARQITALEKQSRIPAAMITAGLDLGDYPPPKSDCAGTARYAVRHHLAGTMLWFGQVDAPAYRCLHAITRNLR